MTETEPSEEPTDNAVIPLTDDITVRFDPGGDGKVRVSVRYDGDTIHANDVDIDFFGSQQKKRTFANAVRDTLETNPDVNEALVKTELLSAFSEVHDLDEQEKREYFLSDVAREVIDGTEAVTVYEAEESKWVVDLTLEGKTHNLEFSVSDIGANNGGALEHAILNKWHHPVELSQEDWKTIRDEWVDRKTVTQVNESTSDTVAITVLRNIRRSVHPVSDPEKLANDPAAAWYDPDNATGYEDAEPDDAILWVQSEFLKEQLENAGKQLDYKGQLAKDLIERGELYGSQTRRRWGEGNDNRLYVYPFDPDSLGIDADEVDDSETSAHAEVPA